MSEQPRDEHGRFAPKDVESATGIPKETIEGSKSGTRETDVVTDFTYKFENIPDEATRKTVEQMKAELEELRELKSQVGKLKEERDASVKAQLLGEIEKLSPHLAEKNKDKPIEALTEILETAKEFKGVKTPPKLKEQEGEQEKSDAPDGVVGHYDLATGKWVA